MMVFLSISLYCKAPIKVSRLLINRKLLEQRNSVEFMQIAI